ncbi:hypothetical protein PHYSODRAFT_253632 [Phytophthora sojae]|uniref:Uncharacterized protein n=1 Tax=Phytophthora sojae (strain P6497) TaxID=1094619 RepID=G5AAA0_PHYSP|nr:hypothetical protein PHYSODRAFT_253632 [Phytophthora sojae]EGZ07529.1 hypothetical protein PHYSODRAFT_253632 [Phytophthora sojae]|eukprot:XP_009537095.1 hypothetical protein PHYSODRAFT_253632 [Phytophthora sojae]
MSDYQNPARNSGNDLDYEALGKLTQFKAFKNNPEELHRHEPALLKEFYAVYLADQALKADAHAQTAGSGSSKLSQRGEHLAIEQCDIQATQQLIAARNQASQALDQAPGPPISVQAQTPVAVQDVHEDMNNLTREVDERKKKLVDREKEVAT